MNDSNDPFFVFGNAPNLGAFSASEYVKTFERGFEPDLNFNVSDVRARRLFERRDVGLKLESDVHERAFYADALAAGVGIAGIGLMGVSIAAAFIGAGIKVVAYDSCLGARETAKERVKKELAAQRARNGLACPQKEDEEKFVASVVDSLVNTTGDIRDLGILPVVVESIPEKLKLKEKFYRDLAKVAKRRILLLTNTSSLRVEDLAEALSNDENDLLCRERFAAFHFFHPVVKRNLVEIAPNRLTNAETLLEARLLGRKIGKLPIVVNDGPGLLVNRLLQAYLNEALRLLDFGFDAKRLEALCKKIGMEGTPLRMIDEIGVDVALHSGWSFLKAFPDRAHNSPTLVGLVREGRLGRKTTRGFYRFSSKESWANDAVLDCDKETLEKLRKDAFETSEKPIPNQDYISDQYAAMRILEAILYEAKRAVDEKIVGSYREADAGLVLALGFPPQKGGIFYWAIAAGRI